MAGTPGIIAFVVLLIIVALVMVIKRHFLN